MIYVPRITTRIKTLLIVVLSLLIVAFGTIPE